MTREAGDGVLLIAHGTVETTADLPAFLAEIRRGRPAPEGLVAELVHRYEMIGGSPLLKLTREQAAALSKRLDLPVLVAMRLWRPRVEEVLLDNRQLHLTKLCVLPLAPFSAPVYNQAAAQAFDRAAQIASDLPELIYLDNWGLHEAFIEAHAALIEPLLKQAENGTHLVLTAHSLPRIVVDRGDPYATLIEAAAQKIAARLATPITLAYQSRGADGGEWLGPDLEQVLRQLRDEGVRNVLVAPFGFLADHVETLYDLDIEARQRAEALGLCFLRAPALNSHPQLIDAMARVVREGFEKS